LEWYADENGRRYCETCKVKYEGSPPCEGCKNRCQDLAPENEEAFELWCAVQTQWRASSSGVLGLDYGIVFKIAQFLQIEMSRCLFHKIQALERVFLVKQNKKIEAKKHDG